MARCRRFEVCHADPATSFPCHRVRHRKLCVADVYATAPTSATTTPERQPNVLTGLPHTVCCDCSISCSVVRNCVVPRTPPPGTRARHQVFATRPVMTVGWSVVAGFGLTAGGRRLGRLHLAAHRSRVHCAVRSVLGCCTWQRPFYLQHQLTNCEHYVTI
jgi:hypothetical protein